jgi:hypothetical protein
VGEANLDNLMQVPWFVKRYPDLTSENHIRVFDRCLVSPKLVPASLIPVAELHSVLRSVFAHPPRDLCVCPEPCTAKRFCMINELLDHPDPRTVAGNVRVH